ncbi:MAG: intradiol ring-cleavage dioxygenase, partial [Bacteroidota bacterium]
MERKEFLKQLGMTGLLMPLFVTCKSDDPSKSGSCTVTDSETAGPFPTKSPSTLEMTDIRSDRTGVAFTIKITIQNKNNSCAALADAIVDIWHCDKDGY